MNNFAEWIQANQIPQRKIADELKISTSTLHDILRKDLMPNVILVRKIEIYTSEAITIDDWINGWTEKNGPIDVVPYKIDKYKKKK